MNILFLNLYSKKVNRGAESFTHELINRLQPYHHVRILKGNSNVQPNSQFTGTIFQRIAKRLFLDRPGRQVLLFSLQCLPHIISHDYQVIMPLNGFWQLLLLKIIQPFKKYKIVVVGHSGPGWDERWNLYLKPHVFVAITQHAYQWATKTASYVNTRLIPLAVDPEKFHSSPIKIKLQSPIILCPAALVPYKQIDLAIQAVSRLKQGSLVVLGMGELQEELIQLGQQLLGKNRFLLKSVPYEQMPQWYAAADLITLPSAPQENAPMVYLESLAAQKVVVTTDSPRARWILEDAGVFTNPQDSEKYALALTRGLKMKHESFHALEKFTWDNVLTQYLHLFNHLETK